MKNTPQLGRDNEGDNAVPLSVVEKILEDFGWRGKDMRWPFKGKDGHRKFATIDAHDLYGIIKIEDFDELMESEHVS